MPFDGQARIGYLSLEDLLLDMIEFSFYGGKKWLQGKDRRRGKHCIAGAIRFVQAETGVSHDRAANYIAKAIANVERRNGERKEPEWTWHIIMRFNDAPERTFDDIVAVIREARELAQVDAYLGSMQVMDYEFEALRALWAFRIRGK